MIDTILNLMFRCSHRRLTRPVTPVSKAGQPHGGTYVVCLDCGKQFSYDTKEMRMGKAIARTHEAGVLAPEPKAKSGKLKYALWAGVPLAVALGVALKNNNKKKNGDQQAGSAQVKPPANAQAGTPDDTGKRS